MRKLATIQKIDEIIPIKDADQIELAKIKGWQVVVKKGEFNKGGLGVFFEIDSFLPEKPVYEFLRKQCYKEMADGSKGFRLRTVKLRKTLSQGLLLPILLLPIKSIQEVYTLKDMVIGKDVTELLGVKLYEPPVPANLAGVIKGLFPIHIIPKTDEERIQNLPEFFNLYKDVNFEETEKLDGSSVTTYYYTENGFGVCSRNLELKEDINNTLWKVAIETGLKKNLETLKCNVAIQCEIMGEGISKNGLNLKGQHFYVYNIYDIDSHRYMTPEERYDFLSSLNNENIRHVPIINKSIKIFQVCDTMEKMLEYAKGKMKDRPEKEREGVVFKSCKIIDGQIVSFKVINNEYLLNEK